MRYGILNGQKVEASPEIKGAKCQCCNSDLVAKCGTLKIWHFAHSVKNNCSSWYNPMTEWHRQWQECFSEQYREIVHKDHETNEKHIADIKIPIAGKELVIEFQNSPISAKEIESRESFYKEMIWVLNGETYALETDLSHNYKKYKFEIRGGRLCTIHKNGKVNFYNTNLDDLQLKRAVELTNGIKILNDKKLFFNTAKKQIYIDSFDGKMYFLKQHNAYLLKLEFKEEQFYEDENDAYFKEAGFYVKAYQVENYLTATEITKEQFLKTFANKLTHPTT